MRKLPLILISVLVYLTSTGFSAFACEPPPKPPVVKIKIDMDHVEARPNLPDVKAGEGPRGVAESGKMVKGPKVFTVTVKKNGADIRKTLHVIPNPSKTISLDDGYYMVCMQGKLLFVKDLGLPFTKRVRKEGIIIPGAKPENELRRALGYAAANYKQRELVFEVHEAKEPQVVNKSAVIPGTLMGHTADIGAGLGKWTASETNGREYTVYPSAVLAKVKYEPERADEKEVEEPPKTPEIPELSAAGVINTPELDSANVAERMDFGKGKLKEHIATGDITPLAIARDQFLQVATDVAPGNREAWRYLAFCDHLISQHPATWPENRKVYRDRARWSATWKDRGGWTKSLEELWANIEADLGVETKPAPPPEKERGKPAKAKPPKAKILRSPKNPTERAITARDEMRRW